MFLYGLHRELQELRHQICRHGDKNAVDAKQEQRSYGILPTQIGNSVTYRT